jgi:hypothetical protein
MRKLAEGTTMPSDMIMSCPLCGADAEAAKLGCPSCHRPIDVGGPPFFAMNKLYCNACKCEFPAELLGPEERVLIAGVKKALKEQDEGRNSSCWPLVSFGWKDADLDAEGCTGIKRIIGTKEDRPLFEIGGHKTFVASDCLDTDDEEKRAAFDERMRSIVCDTGYHAEWSGDDWCVSFSDVMGLAIVRKPDDSPDFEETAKQVIDIAEKLCRPFEEAMAHANDAANELYEEMNK